MKKIIMTIALLFFICVAEMYYISAKDIFLIKKTGESAILELEKPIKDLQKTDIYKVIKVDEHGNTDVYKAYYFKNIVMFMYILVDKDDKVTFLFWSDDQEFVYRNDIDVTISGSTIKFSEKINFKINIKE